MGEVLIRVGLFLLGISYIYLYPPVKPHGVESFGCMFGRSTEDERMNDGHPKRTRWKKDWCRTWIAQR